MRQNDAVLIVGKPPTQSERCSQNWRHFERATNDLQIVTVALFGDSEAYNDESARAKAPLLLMEFRNTRLLLLGNRIGAAFHMDKHEYLDWARIDIGVIASRGVIASVEAAVVPHPDDDWWSSAPNRLYTRAFFKALKGGNKILIYG